MRLLPLLRQIQALTRARQERSIDQQIVFQKAQENAAQHPVDHGLIECAVEESLKRVSRPAEIESLSPLGLHSIPLRPGGVGRAQVRVESPSKALQVSEEFAGVDHE
jgi:hypothetical protein